MRRPCLPVGDGLVKVNSDNPEDFYMNGALIGSDGEVQDPWADNHEWSTIQSYSFTPVMGTNVFDVIVRNYPGSTDPTANPTGLIYEISFDHYTRNETGWAGEMEFDGSNWAKYFGFQVGACNFAG
jgi:hypothetical protein